MPLVRNPRVLLAAGVLVVAVVVGVVALAVGGSNGSSEKPRRTVRAKLTLEQYVRPDTGVLELIINLPDKRLNRLETTGGKTLVSLRCVDEDGVTVVHGPTDWPLLEEFGYPLPHIHQGGSRKLVRSIRRCTLTGPGISFSGSVPGPAPRAGQ